MINFRKSERFGDYISKNLKKIFVLQIYTKEKMQTKEILKQIKKIEITTKRLVDSLITGNYHSVFKGQGIEFSEIREYKPGDDIRTIDWKVTARFNKPFIKEYIEERNLRIYFALDISGSGAFGNLISKKIKAIEMVASLMFAALRNNDNVGLFLFTDKIEKFIPAKKGKKHILKLIREMVTYEPKSKTTDINKSLIYISNVLKKRSILFIVSDFYSADFFQPLKILKKKQDVIAIRIHDERELNIPEIGLIQLEDEETGEQLLVDTSNLEFQKNYNEIILKTRKEIDSYFKKMKVDVLEILTNESYAIPLKKFFNIRKKRRFR